MSWQPWTTEAGALHLADWPDHEPGHVLVDVDVFEPCNGRVISDGFPTVEYPPPYGHGGDTTHADILPRLFAHIDAHPATHYILRTRHLERLRECWPKNTNCVCPGVSLAPGAECDHHPSCPARGYHRPNTTLQIGPVHTQAEADRLLPAGLECSDLVSVVEVFAQPTERIDCRPWLPGDDGCGSCDDRDPHPPRCMSREIPREQQCPRLREVVTDGGFDPADKSTQWIRRHTIAGITVSGGEQPMHKDWVRCLRDQATAANVPFVFESWGEWQPVSYTEGGRANAGMGHSYVNRDTGELRLGFEIGEGLFTEWSPLLRVGREHSGNTLDGRTWPRTEVG